MRLGQLGLPLPVEPVGQQTIHFSPFLTNAYYAFTREHPTGKLFKEKLLSDPRFQNIEGKMLSNGTGASKLEVDHLAAWYFHRANEVGMEHADRDLNYFLNSQTIELLATVWVYGLTTKTRITLADQIELIPVNEMPLSTERFDYQRSAFSNQPHHTPAPQAAIIKAIKTPKILPDFTTSGPSDDLSASTHTASEAIAEIHNICVLLNAIPGICCMPGYHTFYRKPQTPTDPFGGSGGGWSLFDTLPRKNSEFKTEFADLLRELAVKFNVLPGSSKMRIESALHRLA